MGVAVKHVPAWKRHKIAEAEAKRNAPPVAGQTLAALVSKLGDMATDADKRGYLRDCITKGMIDQNGAAYVARVAGVQWTA